MWLHHFLTVRSRSAGSKGQLEVFFDVFPDGPI